MKSGMQDVEDRELTELSEQDLDKVAGGASKESYEETIRNATTVLPKIE
jgi:hypothetical protein